LVFIAHFTANSGRETGVQGLARFPKREDPSHELAGLCPLSDYLTSADPGDENSTWLAKRPAFKALF